MTIEKKESHKHKNGHVDNIAIKVSGTILAVAIVTIFSGYASTFVRASQLNRLEKETINKTNELNTKITILETNYTNILDHLKSIKKSLEK
ncbi:hypothetical protein KAU11_11630 [Candidatus Babeliales bacterium]|nr:hypothetical protein [Candidatus Babeliales bacterium]